MVQRHPAGWRPAVWYGSQNIHYLAFQGGGGKGIAYVGAIEWLEKSLDQKNDPPQPLIENPKIKGLSGASAGAITALLVSLGYGYQQLQWLYSLVKLSDLVDDPEYGTVRCVSKDQRVLKLGALGSVGRAAASFGTVFEMLSSTLLDVPKSSLEAKLLSNPGYWGCLLYDGGMLSGINLRGWLGKRIRLSPLWAQTSPRLRSQLPQDGTEITFQQLHQMGGSKVDLAIVATNLTTGRPMVFARSSTPNFPVADAVAMSASLPPVFKPVWVSSSAPLGPSAAQGPSIPVADYVGWYVDGGVANNVPIHVFDQDPKPVSYDPFLDPAQVSGTAVSLNEYVLGLLLSPGDPVARSPHQSTPDPKSTQSLGPTLGQLIDALQFGANMGQLRSQEEAMQAVLIYTDGVGLVDFVPQDPEDAVRAQQYGFDMMNSYYTIPPRPIRVHPARLGPAIRRCLSGKRIALAVEACEMLLAVIGPQWLTATDEQDRRGLDDPDDTVRIEIEAALARNIRVIPILVEDAVMPRRQDLPESLATLAHRNAFTIRHESFHYDAERLITFS